MPHLLTCQWFAETLTAKIKSIVMNRIESVNKSV